MRITVWLSTSCMDEKSVNTRQSNRPGEKMYPWGETEIVGRKAEAGTRKSARSLTSPACLQACSDTQRKQTRWSQNSKSILWQLLRFTTVQNFPLEMMQTLPKCFFQSQFVGEMLSLDKKYLFVVPPGPPPCGQKWLQKTVSWKRIEISFLL